MARENSAEQFADMIVDNLNEMLEQAIDTPLVTGIALHSYLVGQPRTAFDTSGALRHAPIIESASQ